MKTITAEDLGLEVGDRLWIGSQGFTIRGALVNEAGRSMRMFALGPRVLAAIEADEPFIFTHPEFASMLSARFEKIVDQLRAAGDAMREAESRLIED